MQEKPAGYKKGIGAWEGSMLSRENRIWKYEG